MLSFLVRSCIILIIIIIEEIQALLNQSLYKPHANRGPMGGLDELLRQLLPSLSSVDSRF